MTGNPVARHISSLCSKVQNSSLKTLLNTSNQASGIDEEHLGCHSMPCHMILVITFFYAHSLHINNLYYRKN